MNHQVFKQPETKVTITISSMNRTMQVDANGLLAPVYRIDVSAATQTREKPLILHAELPGPLVDKTDKRETRAIVALRLAAQALTEILAEEEVALRC